MQNLYDTVKKAQMVVQVEAVRVQKELAAYALVIPFWVFFFIVFNKILKYASLSLSLTERSLMVIVKAS